MFAYFLYINASSWESDSDCSRAVCSSQAETEAGISYYQKILRRNVLLRRLLGKEMEYYIQESGEYVPMLYEIEYFRNISTKIKILQDLGEELASEEREENVPDTNTERLRTERRDWSLNQPDR